MSRAKRGNRVKASRKARDQLRSGDEPAATPQPALFPWCPDPANHERCPSGGEHDWIKPGQRPLRHKYECARCGHFDLDDYL